MVWSSSLLLVSLLMSHGVFFVSGCDHCTVCGTPSFSPSTLVVQYRTPASAVCTVCDKAIYSKLEVSLGRSTQNGSTHRWEVDQMTEWNASPMCYYTDYDSNQCCIRLLVTVYQVPDDVSISFVNHSGPMLEGERYDLQCTVQGVAPVDKLCVSFYRGQEVLRQIRSTGFTSIKPVTRNFTLSINSTKDDDGVQYWCKAELELGPEGPQRPPAASSEKIKAAVHYQPHFQQPSQVHQIAVAVGDPLQLNCSAVGNPAPTYKWTHPSGGEEPLSYNDSVVTITSAASQHAGEHVCSVQNYLGSISVTFNVEVKVNYTLIFIILGVVIAAAVVIICILLYVCHYRHNRCGHYHFKDVLHLRRRHVAVPAEDG